MNHHHVAAALAFVLVLAACGKNDAPGTAGMASAPAAAGSGGGAPVSVGTVRAEKRDFEVQIEATGTVTALNSVDIKPQGSRTITKAHLRDGEIVRKGQRRSTLNSRPDRPKVARGQAQLQRALPSLADAERQLARSKELVAQNF